MLYGQNTPEQNDTLPVMSHDLPGLTNFTLEEFMLEAIKTNKGIKLDFKYIEAVEPSMKILQSLQPQTDQPMWINADIFAGPGSGARAPVNSTEFRRIVLEHFPYCTLSISWTTGWDSSNPDSPGLDEAMIEEMAAYASTFEGQPITFPIRAVMARKAWAWIKPKLLDTSLGHSLTIWSSSNDNLDAEDMVFLRQCYDIDRIYYDLPEQQMNEFKELLENPPQLNCTVSPV